MFSGSRALTAFLNPGDNTPSPLVELPASLNPLAGERVRLFAKASFLSPLFNIKQLAAHNLLQTAYDAGKLKGVHTLVENSSGNMALGLAVLARHYGIPRMVAVVPRDIPASKLELLRLFGIDVEFSSTSPGGASGIARAKELGAQDGWYNLGQYENDANPSAYEKYLAPEIWKQTDGTLTVFCAGLGTTGTLVGSARYFKKQSPRITIVGVVPRQDSVPGVRSERRLREVGFKWEGTLDFHAEVETKDAFKQSLELCRVGLLAGPSSGMALAGLVQVLKAQHNAGTLDALRNARGDVVAAFVCPDTALLYLEKYSTHLDPEDFRAHD
ncbi:MAG TPA: pyridoxal-phosphate dependent enzyme [Candidatus Paceibacterota bacterium]|nr:pyridoxal-phosphate dependent enzyme [Candidatus Paceibacterota bacterium]